LGLDVGDRRIGIAVSDSTEFVARPVGVLVRKSNQIDGDVIARFVALHAARAVVVGLPLEADDRAGEQARHSIAFARILRRRLGIPVHLWDERFSTAEASRRMVELGIAKHRRHAKIDAAAASVILDEWLSAQSAANDGLGADSPPTSASDSL
jgi:putative Holliday junction resolvase